MRERRPAGEGVYRPLYLCGIAVEPALVKAVLPGGGTLSMITEKPNGRMVEYNLAVDDKKALSLDHVWWERGHDVGWVAEVYTTLDGGILSEDERYVVAGNAGFSTAASPASCRSHRSRPSTQRSRPTTQASTTLPSIEELLLAFTEAVEKSFACH
ncbi:hypothetical protein [Streptomyces californicus]|uniref:hypothetical protein n=1 Tax=Streptomyces californicus TaxID=67351 RepID=UPI0037A21DA9